MNTYTPIMPATRDWPTLEDYTKGMLVKEDPTYWRPGTTTIRPSTIITSGLGPLVAGLKSSIDRDKTIRELVDDGYWVKMTGSRVTKDGWTSESDWDYVVYDPDNKLSSKFVSEDGWVPGSDAGRGEFDSIKLNDINLILVDKEEIWKKYIIATNLIKTLNSKTKEERISIFDSVFGKDKNASAIDFTDPPF